VGAQGEAVVPNYVIGRAGSGSAPLGPIELDVVVEGRLVATTEALLEYERKDLKELRRLEKAIDDVKDTTVWALVLEVMRADTHKHITDHELSLATSRAG
jgi:hypothetical protein